MFWRKSEVLLYPWCRGCCLHAKTDICHISAIDKHIYLKLKLYVHYIEYVQTREITLNSFLQELFPFLDLNCKMTVEYKKKFIF